MHPSLYHIVLWSIYASAAATFASLLFVSAPYGRYARGGWGLALKPRWAWLAMESPSFLAMLLMASLGHGRGSVYLVFLAMWEFHYAYRSFVYPFLIRDAGKKDFPAALIALAIAYNLANAYVNGYALFDGPRVYSASWLADPRFVAGALMFCAGFATHASADAILRGLRKPGDGAYLIPHGRAFRLLSCPNYSGEILEWCGFALATWSAAGLSFAVFTVANLLPRALSHHRWYRETFPDYPRERRAVLPFLL
jgi:hypothetical protein